MYILLLELLSGYGLLKILIVLPRYYDYVYIFLFVNIEIKTFGWHIQNSGVVLKTNMLSALIA